METLEHLAGAPGVDLVNEGLVDLEAGRETVASLLVSMATTRLRCVGLEVPPTAVERRLTVSTISSPKRTQGRRTAGSTPWWGACRASRAPPSMRERADQQRIRAFLRELGRRSRLPGRIYLTGGATAVLEGWRDSTIDVDLRFEPDHDALLATLPELKELLDLNVELVSPPDFVPELPGWRDRSPFVVREGGLDVHHFDLYSQALSKVERGFDHDLDDVRAMVESELVEPRRALELFSRIRSELYRYPAIDAFAFEAKVGRAFGEVEPEPAA